MAHQDLDKPFRHPLSNSGTPSAMMSAYIARNCRPIAAMMSAPSLADPNDPDRKLN
jgi:hypothetical protein